VIYSITSSKAVLTGSHWLPWATRYPTPGALSLHLARLFLCGIARRGDRELRPPKKYMETQQIGLLRDRGFSGLRLGVDVFLSSQILAENSAIRVPTRETSCYLSLLQVDA
jgi:hypothetical protein